MHWDADTCTPDLLGKSHLRPGQVCATQSLTGCVREVQVSERFAVSVQNVVVSLITN